MTFVDAVLVHIELVRQFNNGEPVPAEYYIQTEEKFLEHYKGFTRIIPLAEGKWIDEESGKTILDFNISYNVLIKKENFDETFWNDLIKEFEEKFAQKKILCYHHDIMSTDIFPD